MYRHDKLTTITNAAIVMQMPSITGDGTNQLSSVDVGATLDRLLSLTLYSVSSLLDDACVNNVDVVVEVVLVVLVLVVGIFAQRQIVHPFVALMSKP